MKMVDIVFLNVVYDDRLEEIKESLSKIVYMADVTASGESGYDLFDEIEKKYGLDVCLKIAGDWEAVAQKKRVKKAQELAQEWLRENDMNDINLILRDRDFYLAQAMYQTALQETGSDIGAMMALYWFGVSEGAKA